MKLISLTSTGNGGLPRRSRSPATRHAGSGVDGSSCNNWTLIFYLVKQGADYLKGAAPSGDQPDLHGLLAVVVPSPARCVAAAFGALLVLTSGRA